MCHHFNTMDLSDVTAGTPKVLGRCLTLFSESREKPPNTNVSFSAPVTPAKFDSNPDIQFFRLVKAKHHYNYHKSKRLLRDLSTGRSHAKPNVFNPYSRQNLLDRLRTFNALNWQIPYSPASNDLTELLCASHGWTCESISRNNNTKNHLRCSSCNAELILRFNNEVPLPIYAPFLFDSDDVQLANDNLVREYITQVQSTGHISTCSWNKIHTPLNSVYYLTPYVSFTDETLIREYLETLFHLTKNCQTLVDHVSEVQNILPPIQTEDLSHFVNASNIWLLSRYYKEDKENSAQVLATSCPPWIYWLAAMGWDLNAQKFAQESILLLICSNCNQRVFLKNTQESFTGNVLSSKVLSPCEFPPHLENVTPKDFECVEEEDEEETKNFGHKLWCLHSSNMGTIPFHVYFKDMLISLDRLVGPIGEYETDKDMAIDPNPDSTPVSKRKNSFNVNEGLERFSKLRKTYFIE